MIDMLAIFITSSMTSSITPSMTPGLAMMLAAIAVPFLPHHLRQVFMLGAIGLSALSLTAGSGIHWTLPLFNHELILYRADHLSLPFATVCHIAAGLNVVYGWYERKPLQHSMGLAYGGAAIAALHAGDFITLFIWWEATALTSVFLVLAKGTETANRAAMRYLLMQVASGVALLAGACLYWRASGSWGFTSMTLESTGAWLIFLAFGVKAAFPLLNGWLQDAYPETTPIGAVILSAFTTKLAIYALARGFAGTELLVWVGIVMAAKPTFYAVLENDLRRVLTYALNSQLGFMVIAIGVGSELAINGAVAQAFIHVIYKSLLFMAVGAVLFRTDTAKASDLGGLYKAMPLTMLFCIIGAMTISAVPLFGSFVTKSFIMSSLAQEGLVGVYLVLMAASAGVFGIKVPYFTFFHRDAGFSQQGRKSIKEAPINMLTAMGIASLLCIGLGVMPQYLFAILPYPVDIQPYYAGSIISQLEVLVFALLGFVVMLRYGLYPQDTPSTILNTDWFFRRFLASVLAPLVKAFFALARLKEQQLINFGMTLSSATKRLSEHPFAGPVIPGPAAIVQAILLAMILAVVYAALG